MKPWELHPALVHFPLAFMLAAAAARVWMLRSDRDAVRQVASMAGLWGVGLGWLAASAGLLAFLTLPAHTEAVHESMLVHAGLAIAGLVTFTASVILERRASFGLPTWLAVAGAGLLVAAGFLGGRMVYREGAGVLQAPGMAPEGEHHHTHSH